VKRALLLVFALPACGGALESGQRVPISLTIERAAGPDITQLQIILASPSSRFDPLAHPAECTRSWIPPDQTLQLTGNDGAKHPAQRIPLSGAASQQVQVVGIPPAKQVVLIVEGLTADNKLVASGFKSPIAEITAGDNAPEAVTLTRFAAPACDPLY
jgi:hypothetical protein